MFGRKKRLDEKNEKIIEKIVEKAHPDQIIILSEINKLLQDVTTLDYVRDMLNDVNTQADMVENIAASSQEMTASIEDISNFVQEAASKTNDSIDIANDSINGLQTSFDYMKKNFDESERIQVVMTKVNEEANKINSMVSIIKGVADQTNLLALNASIEAARAGEHGRGFAVVADEIKKLAVNTTEQVDFITEIVNNLTRELEETNQAIELSNASFRKGEADMFTSVNSLASVQNNLGDIGNAFMEVSANVEEQTAASEEISSAIMIVNEKTKDIHSETNRTGGTLYDISKTVDYLRIKILNTVENIDMKSRVDICISDHLIWRWRVYNMILGYDNFSEDAVGSHKTCRLGQWVEHTTFHNPDLLKVVESMETPHSNLHDLAKKAIKAYNNGQTDHALDYLTQMDVESKSVIAHLKKIQKI